MTTTPRIALSNLTANATGTEFSYSESMNALDALHFLLIKDRDLSAAPGSPNNGDCYLVDPTPASGDAWFAHSNDVACFFNGWRFLSPATGMRGWVDDESVFIVFNGVGWVEIGEGDPQATPSFAYILKEADESVSSSTTLQNDDDLTFTIAANEVWSWQACVLSDGSAGNLKVGISIPSGTQRWGVTEETQNTSVTSGTVSLTIEESEEMFLIDGSVYNGGSAGNVVVQWAQVTSNGTPTKVLAGSWLRAWRSN